jgi:hypothetical protein
MATASQRPSTRLPLVRSLLRPAGRPAAEGHMHFDRAARVWRGHDDRELRPVAAALPECA